MLPEVHAASRSLARRMKGTRERYGHVPIVMVSGRLRQGLALTPRTSRRATASTPHVREALQGGRHRRRRRRRARRPRAREGARHPQALSHDAERLLAEGIDAYQKGDVVGAIERLREGTRVDPLAYRLHFHLGLLFGKGGQIYDAIQALETAIHINQRHFPAGEEPAAILYQKAGLRNKAIEMWERALTLAPDDPTRQSIREHLLSLL